MFCYFSKQHIASKVEQTVRMSAKPINEVLAANLRHFMKSRSLTQLELSGKSHVAQTTISLYLNPESRKPSSSGKVPSAKLSEVESLSHALGIEVWELLRNLTADERHAYEQIENAFKALKPKASEHNSQDAVHTPLPKTKKKRVSPAKNQPNIKAA